MKVPGLGNVTNPDDLGWRYSEPIALGVLGGRECRIVLEEYDGDPNKEDFHLAIKNFLSVSEASLKAAEQDIFRYYKDCNADLRPGDGGYVDIARPGDVWDHIALGNEPIATRRPHGDQLVYISLECGCDWEPEHGLQIVFRHGLIVCKVGAYDGHLTNSDAYNDEALEEVIYRPL